MANTINIIVDQGSAFSHVFQLDSPPGAVFAAMKTEYSNSVAIPFAANVVGSNVTISMTWTQTANLNPGTWVYDVLTVTANVVTRQVEGRVHVSPRVTPYP